MKLFKYISVACLSILLLSACESDLDKVTYDAAKAVPGTLNKVDDTYVLDRKKADEVAVNFSWTAPEMGYQAKVVNNIEVGMEGENFEQFISVASTIGEEVYAATNAEVNKALLLLLEKYKLEAGEYKFQFRISSSISDAASPLYSNVITSTITAYPDEVEYPKVWVIGDYCGWNHGRSQFLYSEKDNGIYEGWIVFDGKAANGWKLTPEGKWGAEWAPEESAMTPEIAELPLVTSGGGNITCYKAFSYYYSFDKATSKLKVINTVQSWGVAGTVNDWGSSPDIAMTLVEEKDGEKTLNWYLQANISLSADGEIKFRADGKWDINLGDKDADGKLEAGGDNIKVAAGDYLVKFYFNKVKPTYKLIAQ